MTNKFARLAGVAIVVIVIGAGIVAIKSPKKNDSYIPTPGNVAIVKTTPGMMQDLTQGAAKATIKRDMLDEGAPKTPTPAAPTPPVQNLGRATLNLDKVPGTIKLSSPQMKAGEKISLYYTCYQRNISPPLAWSNAPSSAKSFVVMFEGPDQGRGVPLQWGVYNIPGSATSLREDMPKTASVEDGLTQATNDFGPTGYSGPCLPKGEFSFLFTIYALDVDLKLAPALTRDELIRTINGHIIDMGKLPISHYYRL